MDDQETNRASGADVNGPTPTSHPQFSVQSLLVMSTWASIWMSAWVVIGYHNGHQKVGVSTASFLGCLIVLFTCPLAFFGCIVGRPKLGVIAGLITSALVIILGYLTT